MSGLACDHYNLYEKDFDILQSLNMNAFRCSIEWSRVEPEEGKWNYQEIDHYRKYLQSLHKRGIEPIVTMWHWTMPVWFTDMKDFEKRSNIKYFERFVTKMMQELGEHINYGVTLNEPRHELWSENLATTISWRTTNYMGLYEPSYCSQTCL